MYTVMGEGMGSAHTLTHHGIHKMLQLFNTRKIWTELMHQVIGVFVNLQGVSKTLRFSFLRSTMTSRSKSGTAARKLKNRAN